MPDDEQGHPYVVGFELHELVVNMCALVLYHSKKISEIADLSSSGSDQQLKDKAKRYADTAESLILRLQDALDESDLHSLARRQPELSYAATG